VSEITTKYKQTHFLKIWTFSIEIFRNSTGPPKNQQVSGLQIYSNFIPWDENKINNI